MNPKKPARSSSFKVSFKHQPEKDNKQQQESKTPQLGQMKHASGPRVVPGFTVQAIQRNTVTDLPPNTNVLKPTPTKPVSVTQPVSKTSFRAYYDRGDLPIAVEHTFSGPRHQWKQPIEELDYAKLLPIFCEGLMERKHPYEMLATDGTFDLIQHGGCSVLSAIPYMIPHLRKILNTKDPDKMVLIMTLLQLLVTSVPLAGEALVPYYRQLLPVLALFCVSNANFGNKIDFGRRVKTTTLGDVIDETLQCLEKHGGCDAFINIKYIVPTYQSCTGSR